MDGHSVAEPVVICVYCVAAGITPQPDRLSLNVKDGVCPHHMAIMREQIAQHRAARLAQQAAA